MENSEKILNEITLHVVAVTPAFKTPDGVQMYEYTTVFYKTIGNDRRTYKIELYGSEQLMCGYYLPKIGTRLYYVAKDKNSAVRGRIVPTFGVGEFLHQ